MSLRPTRLHSIALAATLVLPLWLLHARAFADLFIVLTDLLFLAACAGTADWRWLRRPWLVIALLWWGWEVICSIPGFGSSGPAGLVQALVLVRLILFAAALEQFVLSDARARHFAWVALALSCLWIGLESWQQILTGRNLFGDHRWPDGSLTGPFWRPRAGAPYAHLLFPALLPALAWLIGRKQPLWRISLFLLVVGMATVILIGQRMPTLLALLGLAVAALFLRQLRGAALGALALGAVLIAATPLVSPPTYHKLVIHFAQQMDHFAASPYGELYTSAHAMIMQSPWHGYGFNGFRDLCPQPQFRTGIPALNIPPTALALGACNIHPHNFYLQAATDSGLPGLALFTALNAAWLLALGRGLWRNPAPLRVGLFIGVLTYAWPLASTDSFATLPMAGWLFMMAGLGLAASGSAEPERLYHDPPLQSDASHG
ncbi:MAG: hypothetical protein B7Z78_05845 [Rhodospirillales bacterium 20-60-12]|nr:MAG: hypothetical protein B7Z78_05845 [Rhodospirillales bacterium 20-60-12]HQT68288.1 O-antigen ligase family protein [Acetobacteraceae bacterium]HQU02545.1 O-antigen ligase family protein [Acetobacteraceae bacterium]